MTAETFIPWARLGMWEKLLALAQDKVLKLGMSFLDSTKFRAHQKSAGAPRKEDLRTSEMAVERLAALMVALEPRPA